MNETIGLHELISQIKRELLTPQPGDPVPLLYVEGVDLELRFVARKTGSAGIKLYVVDVGGEAGVEEGHTVRVTMRPLYTREELRRALEADPEAGPQLLPTAINGTLMSVFEENPDRG
jgi:hypothetical protein